MSAPSAAPPSALREQVAAASRKLAAAGLVIGSGGNVSAREGHLVAVTGTGAVLDQITAEQVTIVDAAHFLQEDKGEQIAAAMLASLL